MLMSTEWIYVLVKFFILHIVPSLGPSQGICITLYGTKHIQTICTSGIDIQNKQYNPIVIKSLKQKINLRLQSSILEPMGE